MRDDRAIYADTGVREEIVLLLTSYEPHWLKLGLETVCGEELVAKPGKGGVLLAARKFILEVRDNRSLLPHPAQQQSYERAMHCAARVYCGTMSPQAYCGHSAMKAHPSCPRSLCPCVHTGPR